MRVQLTIDELKELIDALEGATIAVHREFCNKMENAPDCGCRGDLIMKYRKIIERKIRRDYNREMKIQMKS